MNRKFYMNSLVIETTRRCNMMCEHCLRGEAEDLDQKVCHIEKLMDNISSIGNITFSGGEPSLNPQVIKDTLEICKKREISVSSVFVVTNAKKYSRELVDYLDEWFLYCFHCNYGSELTPSLAEDFVNDTGFGLAISVDEFHDIANPWAIIKYKGLLYYSSTKETSFYRSDGRPSGIILEGRAADNFAEEPLTGVRRHSHYEYEFNVEIVDDEEAGIEELYLNCNGNIYPSCDLSYDTQDEVIGNVSIMERSVEEIVNDENVHYDYFNYDMEVA